MTKWQSLVQRVLFERREDSGKRENSVQPSVGALAGHASLDPKR